MEEIKIHKDIASKFNLDPKRKPTDKDGNIILKSNCVWAECFIYQTENLEEEASYYMRTQIPHLSKCVIPKILKDLKYYYKHGYKHFYQAIRYFGMLGKYNKQNCSAVCLLCNKLLYATSRGRGDAPIPNIIDPLGIFEPVVFVTCKKCYYTLETGKIDGQYKYPYSNLIRDEQANILFSEETRWIRNKIKVESPFEQVE